MGIGKRHIKTPRTSVATIPSVTAKKQKRGWPSLPTGDAAQLGKMTSFGAYVLSLALVAVIILNAAAAKFSAATVSTGKADDGYLFQGDPRARNVVEYGPHGQAGSDFDVLPNVDRVVEFYDPHCG